MAALGQDVSDDEPAEEVRRSADVGWVWGAAVGRVRVDLPLIGLLSMVVMVLMCICTMGGMPVFRCMSSDSAHGTGGVGDLRREVRELREEIRKLQERS